MLVGPIPHVASAGMLVSLASPSTVVVGPIRSPFLPTSPRSPGLPPIVLDAARILPDRPHQRVPQELRLLVSQLPVQPANRMTLSAL